MPCPWGLAATVWNLLIHCPAPTFFTLRLSLISFPCALNTSSSSSTALFKACSGGFGTRTNQSLRMGAGQGA